MSTNSLVAYVGLDGTVTSSYVHYDGYTTGVGEMLLENYNSDKCARDLATTLGYASSLRETVAASHEDRANTDEAEVFEDYHEFEEYIRECSHLEYVYVWDSTKVVGGKWLVASWSREKESSLIADRDYRYVWNGFEDLTTVYIREGNETVSRWKRMVAEGNLPHEYLDHANELDVIVSRYHRSAMSDIVEREMASV